MLQIFVSSAVVIVSTQRSGGTGFDPGSYIPKLLIMVLVAPCLAIRFLRGRARTGHLSDSILSIM